MVFLCFFVPAACMFYVSLPSLLPVEPLVFYLPPAPPCPGKFFCISPCDLKACYPGKFCCGRFTLSYFSLPVFQDIYLPVLEYHPVNIFRIAFPFLFWYCLVFLSNRWRTSLLVPDDVLPVVTLSGLQYFFAYIKPVRHDTDGQPWKTLLDLFRQPYKCFLLTILLDLFFTQFLLIIFC